MKMLTRELSEFSSQTVDTLHNYHRKEAQKNQLFEKYHKNELIVIDNNDEDEENETLAGFMLSHVTSEMESFRDSLANVMQRVLERRRVCDNSIFVN